MCRMWSKASASFTPPNSAINIHTYSRNPLWRCLAAWPSWPSAGCSYRWRCVPSCAGWWPASPSAGFGGSSTEAARSTAPCVCLGSATRRDYCSARSSPPTPPSVGRPAATACSSTSPSSSTPSSGSGSMCSSVGETGSRAGRYQERMSRRRPLCHFLHFLLRNKAGEYAFVNAAAKYGMLY